MVVAWLIALIGWAAIYKMPNRYEANARVYVDTQTVLRPLMTGLAVQPDVDQVITVMSRTLISRPNLNKVIRMADLDIGLKSDQDRARLVDGLSRAIMITAAGGENLYTISCVAQDPKVAKRVVDALLTIFVEGSIGDKRRDSDSARRFIEEQLEGYRQKLEAAENAVTAFKRRHSGLMPGGGGDYFVRLLDARTALRQAELELKEAENSKDSVKKQLVVAIANASAPDPDQGEQIVKPETELDTRISALEQKLDNLRLVYTDQHPDIVALVPMIAELRRQKAEKERQLREQEEAKAKLRGGGKVAQTKDPVVQQLTVALSEAEADVAAKQTRVAEFGRRLAELQAAANAMPQIEAEFTQLTRDYDVTKARYDELLRRRESAQISGDMQASDASMGFRVIDPPQVPLTPTSPNRPQLLTAVLFASFGGGFGVAFLLAQIRPTFNDERRLREATGMHVLGTVIMSRTRAQNARRKRGLVALTLSFLSLVSAYLVVMAMFSLTIARA